MPAVALAAFVAGVFALQQCAELPTPAMLVMAGAAALAIGAAGLRLHLAKRRGAAAVFVAAAAVAIGFGFAAAAAHWRIAEQLDRADEGRDLGVVGVIASLPAQVERGVRFEFAVERVYGGAASVPQRLSLGWYSPSAEVAPGERWAFTVRLRRPHGTMNPGGFDLEGWMLERGLRATGYVRESPSPQRLATMVWSAGAAIDRGRALLRERLQAQLGERRFGGVLIALVLGDQRAIAEADWVLFNRTGIAHLVSISGLHITMIAGLAALAVGVLWRRSARALRLAPAQTAAALAAVLAALAYCLLAGWGVPAQRTLFMLATVAAAAWLRRLAQPATTLALAAVVVCLFDPWAVIAPGFWLSFGAVAAILLTVTGRSAARRTGWVRALREAGRVQLAVTLALLPLTVALFRQVAVVSLLANTVAIPVVSFLVTPLALAAGLLVLMPGPIDWLAGPILAVAHVLFEWLHSFLAVLTVPAWASIALPAPPWWALAAALAGVGWLLAPPGWPIRWAGGVWMLPMLVWPGERPGQGELWVTALDVGQGTAIVVESEKHTLLYDAGPRYSAADAGSRIVAPYLRWRGIDALDLMVVSHADSDHAGGAASILRAMKVDAVLTSIDSGSAPLRDARGFERCAAGQQLGFGELQVKVLHPSAVDYEGAEAPNALSCVLRVQLGAHRLLLTGDLPAGQERELAAREPDLAVDWLEVPHHGSRTSSTDALLDATRPAWASVQAGYRNRFGHPDAQVLGRYAQRGVALVRSDESGATTWKFGAEGVQVIRWRESARRYWHNRPDARAGLPQATGDEPAIEAGPTAEPVAPY